MVIKEENKIKNNKIRNIEEERAEFNTHTHTKNSKKWLDRLTVFLFTYTTVTFFWATLTNTGVPLMWCLLVVFPSIGIYKVFEWLWTRQGKK